jgi:DNA repair protein RecO (recombination protein O)
VLRTQQLGEADLIVSLLAEQHGRVRAVARAARKSRKRFGGLLEPLTRVGATWSEKEGRELHRLDALEAVRSFAPMQAEPVLQATCAVLAELSEAFARDGHSEGRTFKLLGAVLDSLENGADPLTVVRYFEYWTLRLHGLMPELTTCSLCSAALPAAEPVRVVRRQGILCRTCQAAAGETGQLITRQAREFLDSARRNPPSGLPECGAAVRPGGVLEALLRGTLESFAERPFRTYRHLSAMTNFERESEHRP